MATSPADLPSIAAPVHQVELEQGEKNYAFKVIYEKGPFDFDTYPLFVEFTLTHQEVSEDFDFTAQSWTVVSEGVEGDQVRQKVVFKRGFDGEWYADREKLTLQGTLSLFACHEDQVFDAPLCIPCDLDRDRCEFIVKVTREGEPYPAERITINASQWAAEGSSFSLRISDL